MEILQKEHKIIMLLLELGFGPPQNRGGSRVY